MILAYLQLSYSAVASCSCCFFQALNTLGNSVLEQATSSWLSCSVTSILFENLCNHLVQHARCWLQHFQACTPLPAPRPAHGIRQTVIVYKEIRRTISLVDRAVIFDVTPVHGGRWCYRRATRGAFQPRTVKLHSLILRQLIKAADRNDMTARRTSEQVRPAFAIDTPCPEVVSTAHAQHFAM